jgi:periplasmic protein TonB
MFENSLIDLGTRRQATRRWLSLPAAVAFHLLAVVSVAFAQYWQVDHVGEPDLNVVFFDLAPLPAMPAEPEPAGAPERPQAATPPAPAPPAPPVQGPVQPRDVSDVIPPIPTTLETVLPGTGEVGSTGTSSTGVPGMEGLGGGGGTGSGEGSGGGGGGTGDGGGDIVYRPGNGVSRPVIVHRVKPRYTEPARKARLQGTVIVEAFIDETGRVRDIKVLKGLPMGLDRSAVDAVSQWVFEPATYEGRPVKVLYSLTVNFQVN